MTQDVRHEACVRTEMEACRPLGVVVVVVIVIVVALDRDTIATATETETGTVTTVTHRVFPKP